MIFFLKKNLKLGVWRTTSFSIGWSNLTNVNFANIGEQIKFIDTRKYYQWSLSTLTATMTEEEKEKRKTECKKMYR